MIHIPTIALMIPDWTPTMLKLYRLKHSLSRTFLENLLKYKLSTLQTIRSISIDMAMNHNHANYQSRLEYIEHSQILCISQVMYVI